MREIIVERKLITAVKKRGGICPKWVCPGCDGMPDRMVLLPEWKNRICGGKGSGRKAESLTACKTSDAEKIRFSGVCPG